ncbi:hypothetical protein CBER1_09245 [Cercospora berteroae]|uniref:4-dimethylallyltryptophan N-methyltransferase n=1 Tax=Cercospora berteroae TaxID=357750 RepID=A0A2S6BXV2_9PEZI|nr:hypothetical protein CBER1_09245 [Cercospora berteroae]
MFKSQFLLPLRNRQTPSLPSALISDDRGLELWSEVTHAPEYYQTRDEVDLFLAHGDEIVSQIPENCSLIDLGSGDLRKVKPLLDLLEASQKRVRYYALDLSEAALKRGVGQFAQQYEFVHCIGLWGSFHHGFSWATSLPPGPKWFLSLGSILGNGPIDEAWKGLARWSSLMGPKDRMLLCMDSTTDPDIIWKSYHDAGGCYERYIRNGLEVSNAVIGQKWYREQDWEMTGVLEPCTHQTKFQALKDVHCPLVGISFNAGDHINLHGHYKYPPEMMQTQFEKAGLVQLATWNIASSAIYDYLLRSR